MGGERDGGYRGERDRGYTGERRDGGGYQGQRGGRYRGERGRGDERESSTLTNVYRDDDLSSSKRFKGNTDLKHALRNIDGRQYPAYRDLIGEWEVGTGFSLHIDRVQADPFAPPSEVRLSIPHSITLLPKSLYSSEIRNIALSDYLTRKFANRGELRDNKGGGGWHGSKGGSLRIGWPSQNVLSRSSVIITPTKLEARLTVALPAAGRRILGEQASTILTEHLPSVAAECFIFSNLDERDMKAHVDSVEDQQFLRESLAQHNLISFVINGARLPRLSGADDRPKADCIPFKCPSSREVTLPVPNRGSVTGMGVEFGVTLLVGGGFHGKSTLLEAMQLGVYNKVPGDGREFVVTDPNAVKIRSEDGRYVSSVNITPFISNLPFTQSTDSFNTDDASGSTSQAVNILEALELGASTLLIDEDTSATNLMIRDERMQRLVAKEKEPITPFLHKILPLRQRGVSTVLVVGGSGDYFQVADSVIQMDCYEPVDVTEKAKLIAAEAAVGDKSVETPFSTQDRPFGSISQRVLKPGTFQLSTYKEFRSRAHSTRSITCNSSEIDLSMCEQLVEESQTRAIAAILDKLGLETLIDGERTIKEILSTIRDLITSPANEGLDRLALTSKAGGHPVGIYAMPRLFEIGAALNRYQHLTVSEIRNE
eukprot:GHVN01076095.1.p1 GENE.GHVN01076095.1~~GHVN01076095.1.p1  ORF type:complete len:655 (-),score=137.32 GHVN01076095.1:172-2136(-)